MKQGTDSLSARDPAGAHDRDQADRAASNARNLSAPRQDAGAASDHETLDCYAAAGGMAPERICRVLADLAPALDRLHRAGRAHGDISPATIGLDASGRARLMSPPLTPAANAEDAPRRDGYAAFEQYTDDPDTPCGPWTDIYALSATACALLTGLAPPPALARCVRDDYVPLAQRRGADERAFCDVLDRGLAVDAYARPQTIDEFARALRLDPVSREPEPRADPRPARAGEQEHAHTLEDSDGLETTSAWASARTGAAEADAPRDSARRASIASSDASSDAAADAFFDDSSHSSHAPYSSRSANWPHSSRPEPDKAPPGAQPGEQIDRPARKAVDSANEIDDEDTPVAVSTARPRSKGGTFRAAAPMRPRKQPRRVPLLMTLAIVAILGAVLYAWMRPQAPRRTAVVASTSDNASGSASPGTSSAGASSSGMSPGSTPAAGTALPSAPASGTPSSGASSSGTQSPGTQPSETRPSETQSSETQSSGTPSGTPTPIDPTATAASRAANEGMGTAAGTSATGTNTDPGANAETGNGAGRASTGAAAPSTDTKTTAAQDSIRKPAAPAPGQPPVTVPVTIRPWGEVFVNGRSRGVSPPLRSLTLAPGKYEITVRNNAGPDYRQTLNVTAGGRPAISHAFQ